MSAALMERPSAAGSVAVIGETPDMLSCILQPAIQLALWQRPRPPSLDWIDSLEWDAIDDIDTRIGGPDYAPAISRHLRDAGYPQTAQESALHNEIDSLALRFAQLVDQRDLRFRLEVIETDACRKFHMDHVTVRLLMPLSGPGTQWMDMQDGETGPIHQLQCGEVGIFKGWLSVTEPAILHRSPPVAASGETRLLLALDPQTGN